MTKNEIYARVVRLTSELAQTNVAADIFNAAADGDAVTAQGIIDVFPVYYPKLYREMVDFGEEFNKLVGDSEEDKEKRRKICESCEFMMYNLAETQVMAEIAKAAETGDPTKVQEVIDTFKKEHPVFTQNLMKFQEEYNEYRNDHKTGHEGAIFGTKTDEENGIFVFDTNVIDTLSFYVLIIFANISDVYFFTELEEAPEAFFDAIGQATNEAFAEFVASYNIVDWIGEDEEYQTVGDILVAALCDEFEEHDEDAEE